MAKGKEFEASVSISGNLDPSLSSAVERAARVMEQLNQSAATSAGAIGKLSDKIKAQEHVLKQAQVQYASFALAGDENSDQAKQLAKSIKALSEEINRDKKSFAAAEKAAESLTDDLEDTADSAQKTEGGFAKLKGALANLAAQGFTRAIEAAKEFGHQMLDTAAEVKAENSQFAQTFGDLGKQAEAAIGRVADTSEIVDTRLQKTATSIYAFARASGADTAEAMALMEESLQAAADGAAYYDKSLEETGETLMSFLKGNYENDAALGLSATEATRNAKAMEVFGKKFNDLDEVQKQQTLLRMVTDAQRMSGAMGQAAREADGWENVQGNLNERWRQFQAKVGAPFLEKLIPVIQRVTDGLDRMSESVDWDAVAHAAAVSIDLTAGSIQWLIENIDLLGIAIVGLGTTMAILKMETIVGSITKIGEAAKGLWVTIAANPLAGAVLAITEVTAAGVLLYRNWDTIKAKAKQLWDWVTTGFGKMHSAVIGLLNGIGSTFRAVFQGFVNAAKAPVNTVISLINGAISGINNIRLDVPDWVPGIGGKSYGANLPTLPMLAAGGFTNGVSIAGEAGTEAVISFDRAFRKQNLAYWEQAGRMLGVPEWITSQSKHNGSIDAAIAYHDLLHGGPISHLAQAGRALQMAVSGATLPLSGAADNRPVYQLGSITYAPQIYGGKGMDGISLRELLRKDKEELLDIIRELLEEEDGKFDQ